MKYLKVPTVLTQSPYCYGALRMKDFLAIASIEHTHQSTGGMFLEEHLLLFVLEGTNTLVYGKQKYVVRKKQMILLPKATIWEYKKEGNPNNNNIYDSILFFLRDDFLKEFVKTANINRTKINEPVAISVKEVNDSLQAYLNSIKPYFNSLNVDSGLLRLKMIELFYSLALSDHNLLHQILQLKHPVKSDITSIVEQNYLLHISLSELAYLSGRSLSSFKRDFMVTYNTPPSKWIRDRRLEKSKELLSNTSLSIADITYMSGFENVTHFSRIFKEQFGYSPSKSKNELNRKVI